MGEGKTETEWGVGVSDRERRGGEKQRGTDHEQPEEDPLVGAPESWGE